MGRVSRMHAIRNDIRNLGDSGKSTKLLLGGIMYIHIALASKKQRVSGLRALPPSSTPCTALPRHHIHPEGRRAPVPNMFEVCLELVIIAYGEGQLAAPAVLHHALNFVADRSRSLEDRGPLQLSHSARAERRDPLCTRKHTKHHLGS